MKKLKTASDNELEEFMCMLGEMQQTLHTYSHTEELNLYQMLKAKIDDYSELAAKEHEKREDEF